jgi:hypothetical protein
MDVYKRDRMLGLELGLCVAPGPGLLAVVYNL